MLEELDKLINFIQTEYINFTKEWKQSDYYSKINIKYTLVCDVLENKTLQDYVKWENENKGGNK